MSENPFLPRIGRIAAVRRETEDTTTYTVRLEGGPPLSFRPGQFNMVGRPGFGESAISLASAPADGTFDHTVRHVGNVTRALARLGVGDWIWVRGPYGVGWPLEVLEGRPVLIVAGGIGLAPLRGVIQTVLAHRDRYGPLTLLYGARTPGQLLYRTELEAWRQAPGVEVWVTVDRAEPGWTGPVGVVTALFPRIRVDPEAVALVCGPEVMMRFTLLELLRRGLPGEQIYLSLERHMRCGVGQCGHCILGPVFVCRDGPVFRYDRIQPFFGRGPL